MKITVIGQGYVGLPLAMAACEAGYTVYGFDTDLKKIESLKSSQSVTEDVESSKLGKFLYEKRYTPTTNTSVISDSEIILLCVPTPLDKQKKPDLSALITATKTVAKNLNKGSLVIVESTIEPGTCRDIINPLLIKDSGLQNSDFELAYSPERIDPTNKIWNISNTPKLVAGLTPNAMQRAYLFYTKFIDSVFQCSSFEVAESAKLLENTFRFVNISMINEISIFCQKLGIDVREVIQAAATKPYGFMPFYPSIGVGGHCIPVDPLYLSNRAREIGAPTRFIDLADQINQEMPGYFVGRAEEKLGGLTDKKVVVIGISYKPNVADVRETPVFALIKGLKAKGAQVSWHDDLVQEWNDEKSVELKTGFDLAIIATPHTNLDLTKLGDTPVLDTRGSV
jgi:UDP-N-acetyl-D-glucosamine dehydrogenase